MTLPTVVVIPSPRPVVAALFIAAGGTYTGRPDVDAWDLRRDAKTYPGPFPVVAHPPCERWGRFADGGPAAKGKFRIGDDGGCFQSALNSVRRYGGVLEHPQGSLAWGVFHLPRPPIRGWSRRDAWLGASAYVDQGAYGHPAKKPTWIYAVVPRLPRLRWTRVWGRPRIGGDGYHSARERLLAKARNDYKPIPNIPRRWRARTPDAFRDELLNLAATCATWTPPPQRLIQASLWRHASMAP